MNAEGRGFPLNRDYLYGSYFFAFVRERYGPEAVTPPGRDATAATSIPFKVGVEPACRPRARRWTTLWLEYQDWLRARFAPKQVSR